MNKGKRMFRCDDCGERRLVHWVELNRAAVPRCFGCGGLLYPHSDQAHNDIAEGAERRRTHDPKRGDLIVCAEAKEMR